MNGSIAEVNIAAAALTAQLCLIAILFVGALILRAGQSQRMWPNRSTHNLAWIVLPFTLLTAVPLVLSSGLADVWRPLLGGAEPPVLRLSRVLLWMFVANIILVAWLVGVTGGSRRSPFAAVYFLLPPLAIFLREPYARVFWYTALIGTLFVLQLFLVDARPLDDSDDQTEVFSYGVVSVLCLILATYIGYLTGPR